MYFNKCPISNTNLFILPWMSPIHFLKYIFIDKVLTSNRWKIVSYVLYHTVYKSFLHPASYCTEVRRCPWRVIYPWMMRLNAPGTNFMLIIRWVEARQRGTNDTWVGSGTPFWRYRLLSWTGLLKVTVKAIVFDCLAEDEWPA